METSFKYDAFISYRHVSPDKEIAEVLQKKLENYKPPKSLREESGRSNLRIFRDETELTTSSDLSGDIKTALEQSDFLISICSKTTKDSRWCMEEIEYFKELHKGSNSKIITLVADGNPEEVFPPLLCNELIPVTDEKGNTTYQNHIIEPLAANVAGNSIKETLKNLNSEFLRIVAPIFGCGYDNLYNREQKKKTRRMLVLGSVIIAFLLLFGIYNSAMLWEINSQKVALAAANASLKEKSAELNQSNIELQQSNEDLAKKTKEAEDNLEEAEKQRKAAEVNLAEAEKQRRKAEQNLLEANRQKKIAEENMKIAQENEAKANEANKSLREKTSEILANQSQIYLEKGDLSSAVKTALEAVALSDENSSSNGVAENTLINATGAYNYEEGIFSKLVNISGYVDYLAFSEDGSRVLATDKSGIIYVVNFDNGKIIARHTPFDTFGATDASYNISDAYVEGNTGYVLCENQLVSIKLKDGKLNWKFDGEADLLNSAEKIISDPESLYVAISNANNYPIVLNKSDGKLYHSFDSEKQTEYSYTKMYDYFMSKEDKIYFADIKLKMFAVYDIKTKSSDKYPLDISYESEIMSTNYEILAFGENKDCVFLNVKTSNGNENGDNCELICFNKKDVSVKWTTKYRGMYTGKQDVNKVFEFTHRIPDENGVYYDVTGIIAATSNNIIAVNKDSGSIYYQCTLDSDSKLLFLEPNEGYSMNASTQTNFSKSALMMKTDGEYFLEDSFWFSGENYTFEKNKKFVDYTSGRFAVAAENSSEIELYNDYSNSNYIELPGLNEVDSLNPDYVTDNGNGILAAYHDKSGDSGENKHYVTIYDTRANSLLINREIPFAVSNICFIDEDTLFFESDEGQAVVMRTDGEMVGEGNLHDMISALPGASKYTYISPNNHIVTPADEGFFYCVDDGIFKVNIKEKAFSIDKLFYYESVSQYYMTGDIISFVLVDYRNNINKMAYYKVGDADINYLKNNGEVSEFVLDTVVSVVNSGSRDIAFINKEGYIGIYDLDSENLSKIELPKGEITPLKICFTPDAEYIIAMCSNGEFIKYSTKTLEEIDRYKSNLIVSEYSVLEFVDENTIMAREFSVNSTIVLVDVNTMDLKAEINLVVHFMKNDRKILFRTYDQTKAYCLYNYLDHKDLVDRAKDFLNKSDN